MKQARLGLDWRHYINDVTYSEAEIEQKFLYGLSNEHGRGRNDQSSFQHCTIDAKM